MRVGFGSSFFTFRASIANCDVSVDDFHDDGVAVGASKRFFVLLLRCHRFDRLRYALLVFLRVLELFFASLEELLADLVQL